MVETGVEPVEASVHREDLTCYFHIRFSVLVEEQKFKMIEVERKLEKP